MMIFKTKSPQLLVCKLHVFEIPRRIENNLVTLVVQPIDKLQGSGQRLAFVIIARRMLGEYRTVDINQEPHILLSLASISETGSSKTGS